MHPNMIRNNDLIKSLTFDEIFKIFPSGYKFKSEFRKLLWKSHWNKCAYCGNEIESYSDMHIDHFIQKSLGINDDISNLICSCAKCNLMKRNNNLEEFRFYMAVSNSILSGIVQPNIVKKIMDVGVDLPIELKPFYFELILGEKNV